MLEYPLIKKGLIALRDQFPDEYDFLPVCKEAELNAFEQQFEVIIPKAYRWFLLNISNGIIHKEDNWLDIINHVKFDDYFHKKDEFNPSVPFEYEARTIFGLKYDELDKDDLENYPYETTTSENHFRYNGIISIRAGNFIVTNGNEYGNVWDADIASNGHIFPQHDRSAGKPRLKFDEWLFYIVEGRLKNKAFNIAMNRQAEADRRFSEIYQKERDINEVKRKREYAKKKRKAKYRNLKLKVKTFLMWVWFVFVFLLLLSKLLK